MKCARCLHDVNLTVPVGKMVALVGESGGGKSTLTKLLPRFHDPTSGQVLWDEVDLRDAQITSLRRQIALVTQETVLFNDTVRHNISYGRPDASEEEIREAARTAFAHDFIIGSAERLRHYRRRTRHFPFRRPAATAGDCPRDLDGRAGLDS